jgi:phosphoribosylformylglycinamidine synthase subunit PurL
LRNLSSSMHSSRQWVYKQFDQQVGLNTFLKPGQADAALLRLRKPSGKPSNKALAVTLDCNPKYIKYSPDLGSQIAMAEAARNLACVGARPLAITDNLNFGNPEKPESFWYLEQSVNGLVKGCEELNVPVVGGNVSLYNEFSDGQQILPTPVVGMVGLVEDYRQTAEIAFAEEGDCIWLLGESKNEEECPGLDWQKEKLLHQILIENIESGLISSCHDLSEGGLLMALTECLLASRFGASIELNKPSGLKVHSLLFGESQSRAIICSSPEVDWQALIAEKYASGLLVTRLGVVTKDAKLRVTLGDVGKIVELSQETLCQAHMNKL